MKETMRKWGDAQRNDMFEYTRKSGQAAIDHEMLNFDEWYDEHIKPKYTIEEYHIISKTMILLGGGFVTQLGKTLAKADRDNRDRMAICWPGYLKRYLTMGR